MSAQLKDLTRPKQAGQVWGGLVKISYGVHNLEAAIAGKSVGEVRQALKEPLNIDPRALALVNGRDVAASHVLKQGDQLEFVRLAGEKGRDRHYPPSILKPARSRVRQNSFLSPPSPRSTLQCLPERLLLIIEARRLRRVGPEQSSDSEIPDNQPISLMDAIFSNRKARKWL